MNIVHIKRIIKNFLWLVLAQNAKHLLTLIILGLLVKKFSYEEIGEVFTLQAIMSGLFAVSNYSLGFYIPVFSNEISVDEIKRKSFWHLILNVRFLLGAFMLFISTLIVFLYFDQHLQLWVLTIPFFLSRLLNPSLIINALETNRHLFKIGVLSKVLLLLSVLLIQYYHWINFWWGLTEIFSIILIIKIYYPSLLQFSFIKFSNLFSFFKTTFTLFAVHSISALKPFSVLPLIHTFFGSYWAGIYTLADKPLEIFRQISGAAFIGFFPVYQKEKIKLNYRSKFFLLSAILLIIFVLVLKISAPYIIYLINDFTYSGNATEIFRILIWGLPALFFIVPLFSEYLNERKWKKLMFFVLMQVLIYVVWLIIDFSEVKDIAKAYVFSEYVLLGLLMSKR